MMGDQQAVLHRIHQVLVREFDSKYPQESRPSITVSDIYYDLVPFQTRQGELGVESVNQYEQALLRLLAGQGGFLELESLADRQRVQRHVDTRSSDPGLFRDLFPSGVRICSTGEKKNLEVKPLAQVEKRESRPIVDCPSCFGVLPQQTGVRFCPFCGDDLRRAPCSSCEEDLRLNWRFCIACGAEAQPRKGPLSPH